MATERNGRGGGRRTTRGSSTQHREPVGTWTRRGTRWTRRRRVVKTVSKTFVVVVVVLVVSSSSGGPPRPSLPRVPWEPVGPWTMDHATVATERNGRGGGRRTTREGSTGSRWGHDMDEEGNKAGRRRRVVKTVSRFSSSSLLSSSSSSRRRRVRGPPRPSLPRVPWEPGWRPGNGGNGTERSLRSRRTTWGVSTGSPWEHGPGGEPGWLGDDASSRWYPRFSSSSSLLSPSSRRRCPRHLSSFQLFNCPAYIHLLLLRPKLTSETHIMGPTETTSHDS